MDVLETERSLKSLVLCWALLLSDPSAIFYKLSSLFASGSGFRIVG